MNPNYQLYDTFKLCSTLTDNFSSNEFSKCML